MRSIGSELTQPSDGLLGLDLSGFPPQTSKSHVSYLLGLRVQFGVEGFRRGLQQSRSQSLHFS